MVSLSSPAPSSAAAGDVGHSRVIVRGVVEVSGRVLAHGCRGALQFWTLEAKEGGVIYNTCTSMSTIDRDTEFYRYLLGGSKAVV